MSATPTAVPKTPVAAAAAPAAAAKVPSKSTANNKQKPDFEFDPNFVPTKEDNDAFDRAITHMMVYHPFYSSLFLRFPVVYTKDVPIAAANGKGEILLNKDNILQFVSQPNANGNKPDKNEKSELIMFILAHEIMHIAFIHVPTAVMKRMDMKIWNYATDFVINQLLDDGKVGKQPKGLLFDPDLVKKFDYDSMSIYNHLIEQAEQKGGAGGPVFFNGKEMKSLDELLGDGDITQEEFDQMDSDMRAAVADAAANAKMQGKYPAHLEGLIDDFLEGKVDWKEQLSKYVCQVIESIERSYSRFNRKTQHMGIYLPSTSQDMTLREIVIGVDTSGSCYGFLNDFANEMNAIKRTYNLKARIIYCDYDIGNEEVFEADEDLVLHHHGGGGTSFKPVFNRAQELLDNNEIDENSIIVYFTDTYGDFPADSPLSTVWAVYGCNDPKVPFGDVVIIPEEALSKK